VPLSPESLAPGIYIREVTSLPHPIPCGSTGIAELFSLASRAPASSTGFAQSQGAGSYSGGSHLPLSSGTNKLHFFPAQGNLLWGSRTTTQDTQWQYVNGRRLTVRIAQWVHQRLQWAVFQPNDSYLWGQVMNSIGNYLQSLTQEGALPGSGAYFVQCNCTTMSQNDLAAGRLVIIVGIAPFRPKEFILLQVTVQTGKR